MDKQAAARIIRDTFESPFDKGNFISFSKNLVNFLDDSRNFTYQGNYIPDAYDPSISSLERIGKYQDAAGSKIDVVIVRLKKGHSLERARTMQRNFIAWYLNGSRGGELKDAAVAAFVSPDDKEWRFSLVRMDYNLVESPSGKIKIEKELTPARRYSFLVGEDESSHTAQAQLLPILQDDKNNPLLSDLEKAFSIEVVTREFFGKYRDLFHKVEEALQRLVEQGEKIREDFDTKGVDTVNFSKKLLGQIVFLYFLQKKGWFGVGRDENWGKGPKDFLRLLFEKKIVSYQNFFNDILEPLFYEALALERTDDFYSRFDCKIPFLNGGLFDPINNYDWIHTDILLPNALFSNSEKTREGDIGTGILDVFDRYNFTVKEDEPLDKEVAIDPEMLGKVFENLLEVRDRKSKGTYYTPREIVHYMCQESLINYLDTAVNTGEIPLVHTHPPQGKLFGAADPVQEALKTPGYRVLVPREDIETFVRTGELAIEHDTRVETYGKETERYSYKLPESIRRNATLIDEKLAGIRVCDPAIGSGAFPVGLMTEIIHARNTLTTYFVDKEGRTSYNFKRHAIQNCLYGVDIDPGAVEIAKLRLWLSLVVDEEDIKQIKPLPNLDYKIVCGNSLLGVQRDMFNNELFQMLEELKSLHFDETNVRKKQERKGQIDNLMEQLTDNKRVFDFEVYFSEVFHEKGGFDAVIANPPYVSMKKFPKDVSSRKYKDYLLETYCTFASKSDLYCCFFEKSLGSNSIKSILRHEGILTFICSSTFFCEPSFQKLRDLMLNKQILLLSVPRGDVFESSLVNTAVVSIKENAKYSLGIIELYEIDKDRKISKTGFIEQDALIKLGLFLKNNSQLVINILEKFALLSPQNRFLNLKNILTINNGIATADNDLWLYEKDNYSSEESWLSNKAFKNKKNVKDFYRGQTVRRWFISKPNSRINYLPDLMKKHRSTARPKAPEFFETRKLVSQLVGEELRVAYDDVGRYFDINVNLIYPKTDSYDLKFILSFFNCKLLKFVLDNIRSNISLTLTLLYKIPIPRLSSHEQEPFIGIVDKILAITKDEDYLTNPTKQAEVKEYECQIDRMVYELYGLTTEEIAVVEDLDK